MMIQSAWISFVAS